MWLKAKFLEILLSEGKHHRRRKLQKFLISIFKNSLIFPKCANGKPNNNFLNTDYKIICRKFLSTNWCYSYSFACLLKQIGNFTFTTNLKIIKNGLILRQMHFISEELFWKLQISYDSKTHTKNKSCDQYKGHYYCLFLKPNEIKSIFLS